MHLPVIDQRVTCLGHCHTTLTGSADTHSATGSCEPHGDHLHCPSGVAKPTTPPAQTGAKSTGHDDHVSATGKACTPHNDHWHCPSGVSAPTYAPTAAQASGSSDGGSVAAATSALSGASRREGVVATGVLAAVLLAALLL